MLTTTLHRRLTVLALATALTGCASDGGGRHGSTTSTSTTPSPHCVEGDRTATVAYKQVPGVSANLTSLDVHAPTTGCDLPVVVWVHGGGYQVGDKANAIADKVRWANGHGWILVSVNYRLTNPGSPTSAQYPDHYEDVAAAIAWVHDHIADSGGDPAKLAVLGHSAGADIVSNVLVDPTYLHTYGLELSAVRCGGPLDTEGFDKPLAGADEPDGEKLQWRVALGNEPDYLTKTSATLNVKPGIGIPAMIGVFRGTAQRQSIEQGFLAALRNAGITATTIDARGLTHGDVNRLIGAAGDTRMTPPLTSFLTNCFAG
ncbi:MAG: alpha/beta hydrolase [Acidimicrobiia bacterium]|nr:alpha/beta hydrolase [Acidimicrobiia bacterium]